MKLYVLLLLLMMVPAHADLVVNTYTNDFAVTSPYDDLLRACACEARDDRVHIENTGNFYSTYTMSVRTEVPWIHIPKEEITLAPGESTDLLLFLDPGCIDGTYEYDIIITSNYGREHIVHRELDLRRCQNAYLHVSEVAEQTNLAAPVEFNVTVRNVADFSDTFNISFDEFPGQVSGMQSVYLGQGEHQNFTVIATPERTFFGDVTLVFVVESERNNVRETVTRNWHVANQFDHSLQLATSASICAGIPSTVPYSLRNHINVPNKFSLQANEPATIDTDTVSLDGNTTRNGSLVINAEVPGTYEITVRADADLGGKSGQRSMEVLVEDCYNLETGFVELAASVSGYMDTACCGEKTYVLNVQNKGQTEEVFLIETNAPAWFQPEMGSIRLLPGENKNVRFHADLPCLDRNHSIPVTVSIASQPSFNDTVLLEINSLTQHSCRAVESTTQRVVIDETADVVPLVIRSTGVAAGTYELDIDAELFTLSESVINLVPGEERVVHLEAVDNLTTYFDGEYLGKVTLTQSNYAYVEQFWVEFEHANWFVSTWRNIAHFNYGSVPGCVWLSFFLMLLVLLSFAWLLWSTGFKWQYKTLSETTVLVTKLVLLAIIFAGLIGLVLSHWPAPAEIHQEFLPSRPLLHQWYQDEQYVINLSQYFVDPDHDNLSYSANQPAHIAIMIDGTIARMVPDGHWSGEESVVFTARDGDSFVDSPVFTLRVLERHDLSFIQWMHRWCTQVNLTLMILVALFLLAVAMNIRPKRDWIEPPRTPKKRPARTRVDAKSQKKKVKLVPPEPELGTEVRIHLGGRK